MESTVSKAVKLWDSTYPLVEKIVSRIEKREGITYGELSEVSGTMTTSIFIAFGLVPEACVEPSLNFGGWMQGLGEFDPSLVESPISEEIGDKFLLFKSMCADILSAQLDR